MNYIAAILNWSCFSLGRSGNQIKNVENELRSVQAQLEHLEERRKNDLKIWEETAARTNESIEQALKNFTGS